MKKFIFADTGNWYSKRQISSIKINEFISNSITNGKPERILLIVPTNRKIRSLKKDFILLSPKKSATHLNIETLSTYSSKMLSHFLNFNELSDAASSVFIEKSSTEVELNYFNNFSSGFPFGTLERIKNVISEYKRQGITPEKLFQISKELESAEALKAEDIAKIYEKFNAKCKNLNAFETGDIYSSFLYLDNQKLSEAFKHNFPGAEYIVFSGFSEFSNLEFEIINVSSAIENTKTLINLDFEKGNNILFSSIYKIEERLLNLGFQKLNSENQPGNNNFNSILIKNLFLGNNNIEIESFKNDIGIIAGSSANEEIEIIAKKIKSLIITENIEPNKICIAFNLGKKYSQIIRDKFTSYGIPFNLTDRSRLDQSNPVTAIINFFEILENNYFYKNIIRALSSGFISSDSNSLFNITKTAKELKIISGKSNWTEEINWAIKNLSDENERTASIYRSAKEELTRISNLLAPFEYKMTPIIFYDNLKELIVKLEIQKSAIKIISDETESNVKALTTFLETVKELINLIVLESGKDEKYSLKFYMNQIRTAANWARYNIKERSDKGVLVTSIEEIRGFKFDYLFIGGMNDGDFPTRFEPEIFLSGTYRKGEEIHQSEERYKFYNILRCWNKKLFLSYAKSDQQKELVRSSFINEFLRIFKVTEISNNDFDQTIFSEEEFLKSIKNNEAATADFIELNENLQAKFTAGKKAFKIDELRNNEQFESVYNGFLNENSENDYEDFLNYQTSIENKQYSVSQLELYARCPFKFFAEKVLRLEEMEEPEEEPESLEIGILLHDILFELYKWIRENKIIIAGCDEEIFKSVEKQIILIARKKFDEQNFKSDFAFYIEEQIFGIAGDWKQSILFKFLETERESSLDFIPSYFEIPFGNMPVKDSDDALHNPEPVEIGGINFRGKIDRIDINISTNEFAVIDYKTGSNRINEKNLSRGLDLQIPVYMIAVQQILEKHFSGKFNPIYSFIYSLKYSEAKFGKHEIKLGGKALMDTAGHERNLIALEETKNAIKKYAGGIRSGKFPLSELEDRDKEICNYCGLIYMCRKH